jgi:hypothetical protein
MKRQTNSLRQQRKDRKRAFWKTLNGLRDKLPIFVVATIAVITLSLLDHSKVSYQAATNSPLEVNDRFVKSVNDKFPKEKEEVWTKWLNNPYHFKYQKFSNPAVLLDALASRAIAENAAEQTRIDAAQRQLVDKSEREKADLMAAIAKSKEKLADITKEKGKLAEGPPKKIASQLNKLDQDLQDTQKSIEAASAKLTTADGEYKFNKMQYDARTLKLSEDSRQQIDSIYNELGPELPSIVLQVQDQPQGLVNNLLRPILDDRSSLYVIFQILRITAMVLLVLSFVFVLVMALRQLPLANGSETISEQLRGLIKGGGGQEVARAAVLGIAAVGVGTAAVVAGNKADRAMEIATASATSPGSNNPFLRDAYYRNNLYQGKRTIYGPSSITSTTNINGDELPPIFSPTNNITVPEPIVRIVSVSDRTGTRAIVNQLNAIGSRLPLADITHLKDSLSKAQQDISLIKDGLGDFKVGAASANSKLTSIDKSLTTLSTETTNSASAQYLLTGATNTKLEAIGLDIAGLRRESLVMSPRSAGRNFLTRAGQFFGSENFAVTEQAYQSLNTQLPKTPAGAAILSGLESLKYQLPKEKKAFLKELRDKAAEAAKKTFSKEQDALDLLKSWEAVILSYTRLPR